MQSTTKHILEVVLNLDKGSRLHLALEHEAIRSPYDLCGLDFLDFSKLYYPAHHDYFETLPTQDVELLQDFKLYIMSSTSMGMTFRDKEWFAITSNAFSKFKNSSSYLSLVQRFNPTWNPDSYEVRSVTTLRKMNFRTFVGGATQK